VNRAATATTTVAGAIGGAAVNGVVGGVKGAADGIQSGLDSGRKSTAAAALAIGALGVAGLVEWPVLLAVGGGALVLQRLSHRPAESAPPPKATLTTVPTQHEAAAKTQKAPARKAPSKAAKKTAGRRAGGSALRSTN
jgi:hypothetical protein